MKNFKILITICILTIFGCAKDFPKDIVLGCIEETAFNYNEEANTDDGSCIEVINGCLDETAYGYNEEANTDDGSCISFSDLGCMDETAFNYDETALFDDGSCVDIVLGCTNLNYIEYNPNANTDDGSCSTFIIEGCTQVNACNYSPTVTVDDGSCVYPELYYDCSGICINDNDGDGVCNELEVSGCTDPIATNYQENATNDDGSCEYPLCPQGQVELMLNITDGLYPDEVTWSLNGTDYNPIGGGSWTFGCQGSGTYTFYGADSYGDGWNGTTATLSSVSPSGLTTYYLSGATITSGFTGVWQFTIP